MSEIFDSIEVALYAVHQLTASGVVEQHRVNCSHAAVQIYLDILRRYLNQNKRKLSFHDPTIAHTDFVNMARISTHYKNTDL